ncbi:hypothetical protein BVN1_03110, partial [Bacillus velezensis]
HDGG